MDDKDRKQRHTFSPAQAISIGVTIDMVGTIILQVIMIIVAAVVLTVKGLDQHEIEALLMDPASLFSKVGAVFGLAISMIAGYVCAKLANRNEYLYVGVQAGIMAIIVVILSYKHVTPSYLTFMTAAGVTATLFGAFLRVRKKETTPALES